MNHFENPAMSPLMSAAMTSDLDSINKLLRQGADPNEEPILYAAMEYRCTPEIVRALLNAGANIHATIGLPGVVKHTILMRAIVNTSLDVIEALLEAGANPNVATIDGRTALMIAVDRTDAVQVLPMLIRHGADVNAHDNMGKSVLRYAQGSQSYIDDNGIVDNSAIIDLLIRAGAQE